MAVNRSFQQPLFVDRELEIKQVNEYVTAAEKREKQRKRVVVFCGDRGCGKSWLTRMLHADFQRPQLLSLWVSLASDPPDVLVPDAQEVKDKENESYISRLPLDSALDDKAQSEKKIAALLHWILQRIGATAPHNATLAELTDSLMRNWIYSETRQEQAMVLILDSVYEADQGKLLKDLEHYLLAPVSDLDNSLIVMTGRGKPVLWETPNLRVYAEVITLKPFTQQYVQSQLEKQTPQRIGNVKLIWRLGGGYPLNNRILAEAENPIAGLNDLISELLLVVDTLLRKEIRFYLEALCIAADFREEEMHELIDAYAALYPERWADVSQNGSLEKAAIREIRDLLVGTFLVHWAGEGFCINDSVRQPLVAFLYHEKPGVFQRMKRKALDLYADYAERFPRASAFFEKRSDAVNQTAEFLAV